MTPASNRPRLVLTGTNSGAGKTTLTIGIMAALKKRGLQVQGFKVGPDYIDPSYHTAATGRISRNLDTWMMEPDMMREIFWRGSEDADLSVIEGVMGFYDGKDPLSNRGSTAEISLCLDAPVILVVDVKAMARSAAAIVKGFQTLEPSVKIAGVIANRCGSAGHYQLVKAAVEQMCGVPVIGYLLHDKNLSVPERHLGLIPAIERGEMQPWFDQLAEKVEAGIDLDLLMEIARGSSAVEEPEAKLFAPVAAWSGDAGDAVGATAVDTASAGQTHAGQEHAVQTHAAHTPSIAYTPDPVHIAVARDAAFNFYYQENLELLQAYGATLHFFSPLAGELPPAEADALYIGGGFPEEFAATLAMHADMRQELKRRIQSGLPTFAECGGFMFLTEAIHDRAGNRYEMVGLIPNEVRMQDRLAALGYREATAQTDSLLLNKGETARGHEFHYSTLVNEQSDNHAYEVTGLRGTKLEGYATGNVLAGYTHLHFASHPQMVARWLDQCREYRNRRVQA
ncbi:cobyrinate a,c-diamide synthase [Brevibacillus dissolubilis]|uniref:cobyrinate a,c-diamide synthase n=1 Tax=Brevibacillus dissolubilis TaxID=1844116 RepID=UPI00111649F6|nr:cobyrinate a,c-diamide synthase [Brevibacillus dissolubilis]